MSKKMHDQDMLDPRVKIILSLVSSDDTILDIGCVDHHALSESRKNWLHRHLVQKAKEVVGLDIAKAEVAKLNAMGYKILVGNAESMDLERRFDVIIGGEIIEHLGNPGSFLQSAARHLLPSGRLIISTPNPFCLPRVLSILRTGKILDLNSEHIAWFDPMVIRQLLDRYGLVLTEAICVKPKPSKLMSLLGFFLRFLPGWDLIATYDIVYVARQRARSLLSQN